MLKTSLICGREKADPAGWRRPKNNHRVTFYKKVTTEKLHSIREVINYMGNYLKN